jgi:protein CMS1
MDRLGDDLDDDFVPDELVAYGDEDHDEDLEEDTADGNEGFLSGEEYVGGDPEVEGKGQALTEKKRKRREKEKEKKAKKRKLVETVDAIEPTSIAAQSPVMLADYLSSMQAKTFSTLSPIELGDMQIPETSIANTTMWTGPRTLDLLAGFIAKVLPTLRTRLSQKSKSNGAPTLIFVTGAALRVADVTRVLKDKKLRGEKGGEVAKLFAKHFKLEDHVKYLKRTKVGAAVGTPGRIGKLICETDAFTLSAVTHIILDATFRDAKKRSLLDIPETRDEVFKTVLGASGMMRGIKEGKIQVVLF